MKHVSYGRSHLHLPGQLTYIRQSDGPPQLDGDLMDTVRSKIRHYRKIYLNHEDPIAFLT